MPIVDEKEYFKRRVTLGKKLNKNSVTVIFSASFKTRSNDTEFPYRQNSNFYYLCGFKEENACLVFVKSKSSVKTFLFVQKKEKEKELWSGKRLGELKAKQVFNVRDVFIIDDLHQKMRKFLLNKKTLYYDFNESSSRVEQLKKLSPTIYSYENIAYHIGLMRLIKSNLEIQSIQKAISITKKAHHKAMAFQKLGKNEYHLQAKIENSFKKRGAYSDAYTSIVASGNAANTLHYIDNNKKLKDGELILIDAGCEFEYYASDITRTIPVNGKFNEPQKELYNMVLNVELEIIEMVKPNIMRSDLQKEAIILLTKGMLSLGILNGSLKSLIKKEAYKKYYPHGIGHWMGIDVHDESPYRYKNGKEIALAEGMVLTIEPGIYLDKKDKSIPKKYRGIGIRIEDDILVTRSGYKNLSVGIAKSVEEIENISS